MQFELDGDIVAHLDGDDSGATWMVAWVWPWSVGGQEETVLPRTVAGFWVDDPWLWFCVAREKRWCELTPPRCVAYVATRDQCGAAPWRSSTKPTADMVVMGNRYDRGGRAKVRCACWVLGGWVSEGR